MSTTATVHCTSCATVGPCVFVPSLGHWLCGTCLMGKLAADEVAVVSASALKEMVACQACGDAVGEGAVCAHCAECDGCSHLAMYCEEHAGSECENCGDRAETCYSCSDCEESHGEYCHECGEEADYAYCSEHVPVVCGECGNNDSSVRVLCESCAREEWLTGTVPLAVIGEDGIIRSDGLEVTWSN